jgi:hypothetical protein
VSRAARRARPPVQPCRTAQPHELTRCARPACPHPRSTRSTRGSQATTAHRRSSSSASAWAAQHAHRWSGLAGPGRLDFDALSSCSDDEACDAADEPSGHAAPRAAACQGGQPGPPPLGERRASSEHGHAPSSRASLHTTVLRPLSEDSVTPAWLVHDLQDAQGGWLGPAVGGTGAALVRVPAPCVLTLPCAEPWADRPSSSSSAAASSRRSAAASAAVRDSSLSRSPERCRSSDAADDAARRGWPAGRHELCSAAASADIWVADREDGAGSGSEAFYDALDSAGVSGAWPLSSGSPALHGSRSSGEVASGGAPLRSSLLTGSLEFLDVLSQVRGSLRAQAG